MTCQEARKLGLTPQQYEEYIAAARNIESEEWVCLQQLNRKYGTNFWVCVEYTVVSAKDVLDVWNDNTRDIGVWRYHFAEEKEMTSDVRFEQGFAWQGRVQENGTHLFYIFTERETDTDRGINIQYEQCA